MKTSRRHIAALGILVPILSLLCCAAPAPVSAESCEKVVQQLNRRLTPKIDEKELVTVLRTLNRTSTLPPSFLTKKQARKLGWKPGMDLWEVKSLQGKSIGGDTFRNRERQLPDGGRSWREADLDYKGGHRGPKRIVFSGDGKRLVTVDHYRSFTEVPACQ